MRTTSILLIGAAAAAIATPSFAQSTQQDVAQAANQPPDTQADAEIVVTGTRRTDRSVTDSASPVDVIGSAELGAQPVANMLDAVSNLVPSFFVGQNSISDASTFVRAPSLRGLPADRLQL